MPAVPAVPAVAFAAPPVAEDKEANVAAVAAAVAVAFVSLEKAPAVDITELCKQNQGTCDSPHTALRYHPCLACRGR